MAKKEDLHNLTSDDLRTQLNDAREELMKLRFQQATGELTDTNRLRVTRRQIARLQTLLNERAAAAQEGGA